jgi:uncharacterized membrane protein
MSVVQRTLERVETLEQVDAPAGAVQGWLHRVLPDRLRVAAPLGGSWLGHPLHPVLVLAPIGAWLSACVLDAMPGQQPAARRLVLTGLIAAAPAVVTGAVDYRRLAPRQRRVGFVHLLANLTAGACYAASYQSRRRGHPGAGQALALLGLAAVGTGGTLGGHLTYAQGVGVFRWQPERALPQLTEAGAGRPR